MKIKLSNGKEKFFISCLGILFIASCGMFDYERSKSEKIIGDFYVVNLHLTEHPGYFVLFKDKSGHERTFLGINEYVDYFKANDSIIIIKTRPNPEISYYFIKHKQGKSVFDFRKIYEGEFKEYESNSEFQKTFLANHN